MNNSKSETEYFISALSIYNKERKMNLKKKIKFKIKNLADRRPKRWEFGGESLILYEFELEF